MKIQLQFKCPYPTQLEFEPDDFVIYEGNTNTVFTGHLWALYKPWYAAQIERNLLGKLRLWLKQEKKNTGFVVLRDITELNEKLKNRKVNLWVIYPNEIIPETPCESPVFEKAEEVQK
jgi:hypothetical protein